MTASQELILDLEPHPAPHDGADRVVRERCGGWELRTYDPGCPAYALHGAERRLDVQLWHPARRVSLCSPSSATRLRWELYPYYDLRFGTDPHRLRFCCLRRALAFVADHAAEPPSIDRWTLLPYLLTEGQGAGPDAREAREGR